MNLEFEIIQFEFEIAETFNQNKVEKKSHDYLHIKGLFDMYADRFNQVLFHFFFVSF